ncbi:MAG: class II aldolase/adducin family protein [Pseudomonadota bacterium]
MNSQTSNQQHVDDAARRDLAAALRLAERCGFHEGICNHFSLQIDATRYLLSPHGIHWSRVCASDILLIDAAAPSGAAELSALNIHGAIHAQHPDAACVLHTHMPFATTLTCLRDQRLKYISQNSLRFFDDVAYDDTYNGLAETAAEGARIAATMAGKRVLFLVNHGVVVTGATVADAWNRLYYLERACELQVRALSAGQPLAEIGANLARRTRAEFDAGADYAQVHFAALKDLLDDDYTT